MKLERPVTYLMLILAALIGGGGLLAFMIFLFRGSYNLVDLKLNTIQVLLLDAFLCLFFFAQHSLMAQKRFRMWAARFLPMKYYGAFYAVASGIIVLVLIIFWQESSYTLISPEGPMRVIPRVIFGLAIANVGWTIWSLGIFVNFRLQGIVDDLRGRRTSTPLITDHGPYRWIRHPLYLSSLLMIWSNPDLTLDRLVFNLMFTVWVLIAILLEEQRLLSEYGQSYREYQKSVPMLIPVRISPKGLEKEPSIESRAS